MARSEQTKGGSGEATGPLALSRLLGLIDALAISRDGLTLSQLNEKLQSPRSSLMNLLRPTVFRMVSWSELPASSSTNAVTEFMTFLKLSDRPQEGQEIIS